jgi:hypothetical protein
MLDPRILGKIKKCLALSASSNPNEAAIALRQAHALMERHGVSVHEIHMADIGESETKSRTMARDKPARWEVLLATMIGKAFGCKVMFMHHKNSRLKTPLNNGTYVFVGLKHQAEVASYTASVLARKCKITRQTWLKENLSGLGQRPGGKAKMTRMGDMFAEGWCLAVTKLVSDFANPPEVDSAIATFIKSKTTGDEQEMRSVEQSDKLEQIAAMAGMKAAKDISLYRPMNTADMPLSISNV